MRYVTSRVLVKTGLCSNVILQRNGYRVRFHPANISVEMFMKATWFEPEEAFIQSLLREGDTFVDVGANIGHLAIAGKVKAKHGTVVAIEAHPRTFRFLTENIRLNGLDIDARNVAVGDTPGTLTFSDMHADDCNGVSVDGQGIEVPVQTLDAILQGTGEIRLLKVDIEGYELMAFRGASEVLARTQFVHFELWDQMARRYGYEPGEVVSVLHAAGFTVFEAGASSGRQEVRPDADFSRLANYLAVRQ